MPNPFEESAKKITDAQEKAISDAEFAKGMTAAARPRSPKTDLGRNANKFADAAKRDRNAFKNRENIAKNKAAMARKAGTKKAVDIADKLGAKAGISKPVRDAATKPYRK